MTDATTEVRRLLDERGVEWVEDHDRTCWMAGGTYHSAYVNLSGNLIVTNLTPQQAIDATLGRGECHLKPWEMEHDTGFYDCMECDCGHVADVADWAEWRYCPNCGARIVGDAE